MRVNTVRRRAAVLSEGAAELAGPALQADQVESIEEMVDGRRHVRLPARDDRAVTVSLDPVAEWGLDVHNLNGSRRSRSDGMAGGRRGSLATDDRLHR